MVKCDGKRVPRVVTSSLPLLCGLALLPALAAAQRVPASGSEPAAAAPTAQPPGAEQHVAETHESFGATARVSSPDADSATHVDADEVRAIRRRQGDGFRLVETLPGIAPVFSGVPYLLVRGAPPSGTTQYYDGVPVPSFFHLALGPAIAHPELVSGMHFHAGVAPARYGRRTGGVLSVDGPRVAPHEPAAAATGELELRLLDAQALVRSGGSEPVSAHARIGYPDLMLDAIGSRASLAYWDYQLHSAVRLASNASLTTHVFGAFDGVGDRAEPSDDIDLQFHRVLLRLEQRSARTQIGASVYAGYDVGTLGSELDARSLRLGPALQVERRFGESRVRVGADMVAQMARLDRTPSNDAPSLAPTVTAPRGDPNRFLPDLDSDLPFDTGPEEFVDRSPLSDHPGRNAVGAYAELGLVPARPIEVEAGARTDFWLVGGRASQSFDPRLLVRYHLNESTRLHGAVGTTHQAPASPLPIPGLDEFALDRGLSRALQSEAGTSIDLPLAFSLETTLFLHRYEHLVFLELVLDCEGNSEPISPFVNLGEQAREVALCRGQGLPRGSGQAYGAEFYLKRAASERLSGWLSYTLAWADARAADGTAFVPQFDVRHLGNLVLSYDWGGGLATGLRLHYRTGKPAVNTIFDFSQERFEREEFRLPGFFRADVSLSYAVDADFGELEFLLSWANVTFAREATKRDCFLQTSLRVDCKVDYQPAIVLPNAGVRVRL